MLEVNGRISCSAANFKDPSEDPARHIGGLGFLVADKVDLDILKNEAYIFMF